MPNPKFEVPLALNRNAAKSSVKANQIISNLPLSNSIQVADIGAGGGFFSFLLSKYVHHVFAVETDPLCIEFIQQRISQNGFSNITPLLITDDSLPIPSTSLDLIFLRNTLHLINDRILYLKFLNTYLKPGSFIAVIDHNGYNRLKTGKPLLQHQTTTDKLIQQLLEALFIIESNHTFLTNSSFIIAKKL